MSPYSLLPIDASTKVDESTMREAQQVARKLAAGGSVVGSISKKIQNMGVDDSIAEAIAIDAVLARSRLERLQGAGIAVFGMCLIILGYLLSFVFVRKIPLAVAISGVFFVMLGCARMFHRSRIHLPGAGLQKMQ